MRLKRRRHLIDATAESTDSLRTRCDLLAEERCKQLIDQRRYQVVYPVLPMDILGIYVVLPV